MAENINLTLTMNMGISSRNNQASIVLIFWKTNQSERTR